MSRFVDDQDSAPLRYLTYKKQMLLFLKVNGRRTQARPLSSPSGTVSRSLWLLNAQFWFHVFRGLKGVTGWSVLKAVFRFETILDRKQAFPVSLFNRINTPNWSCSIFPPCSLLTALSGRCGSLRCKYFG